MYKESKWKQFLNLKQRNLSVAEYEKEFSHLSKYASELVLTEAFPIWNSFSLELLFGIFVYNISLRYGY